MLNYSTLKIRARKRSTVILLEPLRQRAHDFVRNTGVMMQRFAERRAVELKHACASGTGQHVRRARAGIDHGQLADKAAGLHNRQYFALGALALDDFDIAFDQDE